MAFNDMAQVALDPLDLAGLLVDRQEAVDHPDTPSWAMAIAIGAVVTVSILADTIGISTSMWRVKWDRVETSRRERIREHCGTSSTSSKVSASRGSIIFLTCSADRQDRGIVTVAQAGSSSRRRHHLAGPGHVPQRAGQPASHPAAAQH
jgi:hypothetical protein